ncbi:restriction endonuclease [Streptomyces sp. NPDC048248]|uniref:restriction endonuclease n=1 Tax=Streptomyces sp. NPDC048248 TaxID=3365523 RepID=UPI0037136A20
MFLRRPEYGVPSPALLARAAHGLEYFGEAPAPSTRTVLYDPEGRIEAELPLDRGPYEALVAAVLTWSDPDTALQACDYEQIAVQLTGHARAVASDVRRSLACLPNESGRRALAEVVLAEAQRRLSVPAKGTLRCVQERARLVRALYERLDRLDVASTTATSTS